MPAKNIPLINGVAYSFAQIILKIGTNEISSISSIEYSEEQAKDNNFGAGERPTSRGKGTIKPKASIEISMNDIESLRDIATDGSLLKLPAFDVQVTYENQQKVVTHILKNCEFTNDGVSAALDATDLKYKFDLVLSHIKYR